MEPTPSMTLPEAMALGVKHQIAGRLAEAEAAYRHALTLHPLYPAANHNLGQIALVCGHLSAACELIGRAVATSDEPVFKTSLGRALEAYLKANPEDEIGARGQLAALGLSEAPERASAAHMERLYAARAATWPHNLGYRAPELVSQALLDRCEAPGDVLDAGCGTGLVGPLVKPIARRLVGVDLSAPMLEVANQTGAYNELLVADLIEHLRDRHATYDAIASAATLIHFGDLAPVFEAASHALRPRGLFAFTLFPNDRDPAAYSVDALDAAQGGVFFHGRTYVAEGLKRAGLDLLEMTDEVHESKDHRPFFGLLVICRRP